MLLTGSEHTAHLGLGLSSCFCDFGHISSLFSVRNKENLVEVYSEFIVYFFGFHQFTVTQNIHNFMKTKTDVKTSEKAGT